MPRIDFERPASGGPSVKWLADHHATVTFPRVVYHSLENTLNSFVFLRVVMAIQSLLWLHINFWIIVLVL